MRGAPQAIQRRLDGIEAKLDPDHPRFQGTPEIEAALRDPQLKRYLDSWVRPPLREVQGWARREVSAVDLDRNDTYIGYG